jgi:3-dehydroquinate dehydratase-2
VYQFALMDGPNQSNLVHRSKKVCGSIPSVETLHKYAHSFGKSIGVELETFVSAHEGAILEFIHRSADRTARICRAPLRRGHAKV